MKTSNKQHRWHESKRVIFFWTKKSAHWVWVNGSKKWDRLKPIPEGCSIPGCPQSIGYLFPFGSQNSLCQRNQLTQMAFLSEGCRHAVISQLQVTKNTPVMYNTRKATSTWYDGGCSKKEMYIACKGGYKWQWIMVFRDFHGGVTWKAEGF